MQGNVFGESARSFGKIAFAVVEINSVWRNFVADNHIKESVAVEVSQLYRLLLVVVLRQSGGGVIDKMSRIFFVVQPKKIARFFSGISDNNVRKSISIYIADGQRVAFAFCQQPVANVAESAVAVTQVIFVGLVVFGYEDNIQQSIAVKVGNVNVFRIVLFIHERVFCPGKLAGAIVQIQAVRLPFQCQNDI